MDKNNLIDVRRALDRAERGITKSIIRWKCRKEGLPVPHDDAIEGRSKDVVNQAHQIVAKRGRTIWNELRNVYSKQKGRKGGSSD